jgi:geranylgeranylglycerol-phosphate geranylgeranyltransferase
MIVYGTAFSTGIRLQKIKVLTRLVRLPYLLMLEVSCILFMITFQKGFNNFYLMGLASLALLFTTSGGFAINDYFDRESDAIVHPERPIPSNQVSPLGVVQLSAVMFIAGFIIALCINLLAFGIAVFWIVFLLLYSSFFKRLSGFASNILIGFLIGTIPLFSEAVVLLTISLKSLSFVFFPTTMIAGNVLKDVIGIEGDVKAGYPTLAAKRGINAAVKVGAVFFLLFLIASPFPYLVGTVGPAYLVPIALLDSILLYSLFSLVRTSNVQNVNRQLRIVPIFMILFLVALMAGAFF